MPAWICKIHWTVVYIAIPVQALRIARVRDDGVWLGEAEGGGVVEAGVVVHQTEAGIVALAGIAKIGLGDAAGSGADLAEGGVALLAEHRPGSVHDEGGGAEVVAGEGEQLRAIMHRHAPPDDGVVFFDYISIIVCFCYLRHRDLVLPAKEEVARFFPFGL